MNLLPKDYDEQVYAALLGKTIGVQYGGPIEGWTDDRIWQEYGELTGYVRHYHYFRPDDDLSGPIIFIRALEDFTPTDDLTPQHIGDTWLNYLGDGHCTLWWGGYGVSTEHTAYLNLANGIEATRSGSIEMNGQVVAEQIGGQIFIDTWGLVCPGDPERAARYATKAASVSHDGSGIYGGVFIASIEAQAFVEKDVARLIDVGLSLIPQDSLYAQAVRDVVAWRAKYADWRDCFWQIKGRYGYDQYGGGCHIIPNAAIVVMALAYSEGDFSRALHVANMAGWDTDCNVGNVGCIMGLVAGLEGIDRADTDWRSDVHDHLLASQILGSECVLDIPGAAQTIANLGRAVNGIDERKVYKGGKRYHFTFPGSTHSFEPDRAPGYAALRSVENSAEQAPDGTRSLKLTFDRLSKDNLGVVYRKTFFTGEDIERSGYSPDVSPIIYPGQTVVASVYLSEGQGVSARIFVEDVLSGERMYGPETSLLVGSATDVTWSIPSMASVVLHKVGLAFAAAAEVNAVAYLDSLDWSGELDCSFEFSHPDCRVGWSYLRGQWSARGGAMQGTHHGKDAETYTGLLSARDCSYEVTLRPHCGYRHRILFRIRGAQRSYAFGLAPGGRVCFEKNWKGYEEKASAPFPWALQSTYRLRVTVQGNRMVGYVDDVRMLEWEDTESPWKSGCIGLGLKNGRAFFLEAKVGPLP